jgi:aminoacrylate hydrolase
MPRADLGDLQLHYEVHGEGPPVFLVSGLGGLGVYWQPNLPAFAAQHRVIVHDHRGTGQSTHSKIGYSVDQMTDDLVRLMDHLQIDRAHVVGHSTGGAIAQTLAVTRPERLASLVIYASWTKADPFFRRSFEARRTLLTAAGAAAYVRSAPVFLYPAWWLNENAALLAGREEAAIPNFPGAEIVASRIDAIVAFDRTADLPRISAPTLVVCATDDFITPAYFSEALARLIPGAELRLLDRGGHCVSETVPDAFNAAVLGFLQRHS